MNSIFKMWKKVLDKLGNNFDNFDSDNPSLGPVLKIVQFCGLWHSKRSTLQTFILYIFLTFAICCVINMILFLILSFTYDKFIMFIQLSAMPLGVLKATNLTRNHKEWLEIVDMTSEIEKKSLDCERKYSSKVTVNFRRYCYFVICFFWGFCIPLNLTFVIGIVTREAFFTDFENPLTEIENLYLLWIPIEERSRKGRYISLALQAVFSEVTAVYVFCWDSLFMVLMVFIIGQLKATRQRCIHIFDGHCSRSSLRDIEECHQDYMKLIRSQKLLDQLTSPIMFVYLVIITINYGVCVVLLVSWNSDISKLLTTFELLFGLTFQLLMYYYIANEVIIQSMEVSYGTFESRWPEVSGAEQKLVFMLAGSVRRRLAFHAGPYNEISLSTFILILRTSYSFYTLLSREK